MSSLRSCREVKNLVRKRLGFPTSATFGPPITVQEWQEVWVATGAGSGAGSASEDRPWARELSAAGALAAELWKDGRLGHSRYRRLGVGDPLASMVTLVWRARRETVDAAFLEHFLHRHYVARRGLESTLAQRPGLQLVLLEEDGEGRALRSRFYTIAQQILRKLGAAALDVQLRWLTGGSHCAGHCLVCQEELAGTSGVPRSGLRGSDDVLCEEVLAAILQAHGPGFVGTSHQKKAYLGDVGRGQEQGHEASAPGQDAGVLRSQDPKSSFPDGLEVDLDAWSAALGTLWGETEKEKAARSANTDGHQRPESPPERLERALKAVDLFPGSKSSADTQGSDSKRDGTSESADTQGSDSKRDGTSESADTQGSDSKRDGTSEQERTGGTEVDPSKSLWSVLSWRPDQLPSETGLEGVNWQDCSTFRPALLSSIWLKVRRFDENPLWIDLSPITLLASENASGKTTMAEAIGQLYFGRARPRAILPDGADVFRNTDPDSPGKGAASWDPSSRTPQIEALRLLQGMGGTYPTDGSGKVSDSSGTRSRGSKGDRSAPASDGRMPLSALLTLFADDTELHRGRDGETAMLSVVPLLDLRRAGWLFEGLSEVARTVEWLRSLERKLDEFGRKMKDREVAVPKMIQLDAREITLWWALVGQLESRHPYLSAKRRYVQATGQLKAIIRSALAETDASGWNDVSPSEEAAERFKDWTDAYLAIESVLGDAIAAQKSALGGEEASVGGEDAGEVEASKSSFKVETAHLLKLLPDMLEAFTHPSRSEPAWAKLARFWEIPAAARVLSGTARQTLDHQVVTLERVTLRYLESLERLVLSSLLQNSTATSTTDAVSDAVSGSESDTMTKVLEAYRQGMEDYLDVGLTLPIRSRKPSTNKEKTRLNTARQVRRGFAQRFSRWLVASGGELPILVVDEPVMGQDAAAAAAALGRFLRLRRIHEAWRWARAYGTDPSQELGPSAEWKDSWSDGQDSHASVQGSEAGDGRPDAIVLGGGHRTTRFLPKAGASVTEAEGRRRMATVGFPVPPQVILVSHLTATVVAAADGEGVVLDLTLQERLRRLVFPAWMKDLEEKLRKAVGAYDGAIDGLPQDWRPRMAASFLRGWPSPIFGGTCPPQDDQTDGPTTRARRCFACEGTGQNAPKEDVIHAQEASNIPKDGAKNAQAVSRPLNDQEKKYWRGLRTELPALRLDGLLCQVLEEGLGLKCSQTVDLVKGHQARLDGGHQSLPAKPCTDQAWTAEFARVRPEALIRLARRLVLWLIATDLLPVILSDAQAGFEVSGVALRQLPAAGGEALELGPSRLRRISIWQQLLPPDPFRSKEETGRDGAEGPPPEDAETDVSEASVATSMDPQAEQRLEAAPVSVAEDLRGVSPKEVSEPEVGAGAGRANGQNGEVSPKEVSESEGGPGDLDRALAGALVPSAAATSPAATSPAATSPSAPDSEHALDRPSPGVEATWSAPDASGARDAGPVVVRRRLDVGEHLEETADGHDAGPDLEVEGVSTAARPAPDGSAGSGETGSRRDTDPVGAVETTPRLTPEPSPGPGVWRFWVAGEGRVAAEEAIREAGMVPVGSADRATFSLLIPTTYYQLVGTEDTQRKKLDGSKLSRWLVEERLQRLGEAPEASSRVGIGIWTYVRDDIVDPSQHFSFGSRCMLTEGASSPMGEGQVWERSIALGLGRLRQALASNAVRGLRFYPKCHPSQAIRAGVIFSHLSGFDLEVAQGAEIWDLSLGQDAAQPALEVMRLDGGRPGGLGGQELHVLLSFSQNVEWGYKAWRSGLLKDDLTPRVVLHIVPKTGVGRGSVSRETVAGVGERLVREILRVRRPGDVVRIFLSAPNALAMAFGRSMNALGSVHVMDWIRELEAYVETERFRC